MKPVQAPVTEKVAEEEAPYQALNEPFTPIDLEMAWKKYADKETDAHLKNTILNVTPQLPEANHIRISVFNPDQESKLKERAGDIKQYLTQQLRNTQIDLDIVITDDKNDYLPVGGKEIFQYMAEKNPAIIALAQEFNLVLR
jgi:DNA polymerase-3 subunit gamma/tau